jgi:hypothetical protein
MKTKNTNDKQKTYKPYKNKLIVSINNDLLSIQPGQSLLFNDADLYVKTVTDVKISIDGSVQYHLKWFNGSIVQEVWLNENEISSMAMIVDNDSDNKQQKIGFND